MTKRYDIEEAREWLEAMGHATHIRHVLERGLDYAEALERAGHCLETIDGEDLYKFVTDPRTDSARRSAFVEPGL